MSPNTPITEIPSIDLGRRWAAEERKKELGPEFIIHKIRIHNNFRIERLIKSNRDNLLEGKLKTLAKYKLLIFDEIGYLSFDNEDAFCFFQLVSRRYERRSTIFASNKSYEK